MNESLTQLTHAELEIKTLQCVRNERNAQADLIACLAEMDTRKSYLNDGYSSLFKYVVEKLKYSDASAYKRIQIARASKVCTSVILFLKEQKLSLSALAVLAPHINQENGNEVLNSALGKSVEQLRWQVVNFANPKKEVGERVRLEKAPTLLTQTQLPTNPVKAVNVKSNIQPCTPTRANINFSCSKELVDKIGRAKEVLRKKFPEGRLEDIIDMAVEGLLDKHDPERREQKRELKEDLKLKQETKTKEQKKSEPPVTSFQRKAIPQKLKDLIFKKYNYQCGFVSHEGHRCSSKTFLEVDHIKSVCHGGQNEIKNLQLLCKSHHQNKTELQVGRFKGQKVERKEIICNSSNLS